MLRSIGKFTKSATTTHSIHEAYCASSSTSEEVWNFNSSWKSNNLCFLDWCQGKAGLHSYLDIGDENSEPSWMATTLTLTEFVAYMLKDTDGMVCCLADPAHTVF